MTERWREALDRLGRIGPDRDRIRSRAEGGPRMPAPDPGSGRRVAAAVLALAVAAGSFALVFSVFRGGGSRVGATTPAGPTPAISTSPSTTDAGIPPPGAVLYPESICDVPEFDPDVALLVGQESVEYPRSVLEAPGGPASSLEGPASDELRAHLETPAARNAPADGWRVLWSSGSEVTFGAPFGEGEWWVDAFEHREGGWRVFDEEIAKQRDTPAQRGHGMELRWDGPFAVEHGAWNDPLRLANEQALAWTDPNDRFVAVPHVFDLSTGREIGPGADPIAAQGGPARLGRGEAAEIPVALGALVPSLFPATYPIVACVPDLGLASPVGSLEVADDASVADVDVLTYHSNGVSMDALAGGELTVHHGCLALAREVTDAGWTYLILPNGYALVRRGDREVLIRPTGEAVGAIGDDVSFGGGGVLWTQRLTDAVIGGVPKACGPGTGGGYFLVGS